MSGKGVAQVARVGGVDHDEPVQWKLGSPKLPVATESTRPSGDINDEQIPCLCASAQGRTAAIRTIMQKHIVGHMSEYCSRHS